jgi:hypothetical protein
VLVDTTAFVWEIPRLGEPAPVRARSFAVPESRGRAQVCLVGSATEPGLLWGSSDGRLRYWPKLDAKEVVEALLPLEAGAELAGLCAVEPAMVLAGSASGELMLLRLESAQGLPTLQARPLHAPAGGVLSLAGLGRMLGWPARAARPQLPAPSGPVLRQIAAGPAPGLAYALTSTSLQAWRISRAGNAERPPSEVALADMLRHEEERAGHGPASAYRAWCLRLRVSREALYVLAATALAECPPERVPVLQFYALRLDLNSLRLEACVPLEHRPNLEDAALARASLELQPGGALILHTPERIVFAPASGAGVHQQEVVPLDLLLLGGGESPQPDTAPGVLLLSARYGLLLAGSTQAPGGQARARALEPSGTALALPAGLSAREQLERAFAAFLRGQGVAQVTLGAEDDLVALGQSVLDATCSADPRWAEEAPAERHSALLIRQQLEEKQLRLGRLLEFVRQAGLLTRLSVPARLALLTQHEKLQAAIALRALQNEATPEPDLNPQELLLRAMRHVLEHVRQVPPAQLASANPQELFYTKVSLIEEILPALQRMEGELLARRPATADASEALPRLVLFVSQVFEAMVGAMLACRRAHAVPTFGLQPSPALLRETPWPRPIDALLLRQIHATQDAHRDASHARSPLLGRLQRVWLALVALLLESTDADLQLAARVAAPAEAEQRRVEFERLRGELLKPLRTEAPEEARALAEKHRDFDTLIDMAGADLDRLSEYARRFAAQSFLEHLFASLLHGGMSRPHLLHLLLRLGERFPRELAVFLDRRLHNPGLTDPAPLLRLIWLHQVGDAFIPDHRVPPSLRLLV